jgi:hypothetical protein
MMADTDRKGIPTRSQFMITTFVPNCVFIPENPDREACTLLMLDGDNIYGECFTQEGKPFCIRRHGHFEAVERGRVELLPEICIVKIDQREFWCDEVQARTHRIFGVYAFDRRRHVHCCSLTPSYELHFLGTQYEAVEGLDDEDRLNQDVLEGDAGSEEVQYYDCHWIDGLLKNPCREGFLPSASEGGGFVVEGLVSVTTDTALEEVREWYRGSEV